MRSQLNALFSVTTVVIGLGAGPTLVAILTDRVLGDAVAICYSLSP